MKSLEAIARRWTRSATPGDLCFRGSLVTGIWIGRERRPCEDIDFLASFPYDEAILLAKVKKALSIDCHDGYHFEIASLVSTPIFIDTGFPGCRISVPACFNSGKQPVQIDVGFNDPLPFGPIETSLVTDSDTFPILAPPPEVGFAWKLHGLVEKEGNLWRIKDLADLWLIAKHCELDETMLAESIRVAFESRDGPLWRLDRLFSGDIGHSRGSRKEWDRIRQAMPTADLPESIAETCRLVCQVAEPHWQRYRKTPPRYASNITQEEMEAAVANELNFETYDHVDFGKTFVYRHLSSKAFPYPMAAATGADFRKRQLIREARGITFNNDGDLVTRPYPKFGTFVDSDVAILHGADTYEKLDGSLVFPTPIKNGFTMRTRRGPSDISQQAQTHIDSSDIGYQPFIRHCLEKEVTPLFEWCSRQHPIVLDHPEDQLVLTSIRDNRSGGFIARLEQESLADCYDIPIVNYLGKIDNVENWLANVRSWKNREGCIVHTRCGDMFKVKSFQYKLLHSAIEGPNRDRARWQLILSSDRQALHQACRLQNINLETYETELFDRIRIYAQAISEKVACFSDRKSLAESVNEMYGLERQIYFKLYQAGDPQTTVKTLIKSACDESLTKFSEVVNLIGGPVHNDA